MDIQVLDEYDDRGNIIFKIDGEKCIIPAFQKVVNIFREPLNIDSFVNMNTVEYKDNLQVSSLTDDEKLWIQELQLVLEHCPSRFEIVVQGMNSSKIHIISNEKYTEVHEGLEICEYDGVLLATLHGKPKVNAIY